MNKYCDYCGEIIPLEIKITGNLGIYQWKYYKLHEDCYKEKKLNETNKLLSDQQVHDSDDICCSWLQLQCYILNY